jgi:hypothetical protein
MPKREEESHHFVLCSSNQREYKLEKSDLISHSRSFFFLGCKNAKYENISIYFAPTNTKPKGGQASS